MSQTNTELRAALIKLLADGRFYSGQMLADKFGISRTAIANNVAALKTLGLDVFSVKGKGYALPTPLTLLDESTIRASFTANIQAPIALFPVIGSTNTYIRDHIETIEHGATVIAEAQTAGRGRRGKTWVSPFGASLYMSMCWRFQGGYQQIGGLSLFVGYCVAHALQRMGIDGIGLKWPNDIYRHGQKLGGILVEVEGQIGTEVSCIIGIGINVNLPDVTEQIDQPFTDLSGLDICRNRLCAEVISVLHTHLPDFETDGLHSIVEQWNSLDEFAGKTVVISHGDKQQLGTNLGIESSGALRLQTSEGIRLVHGGEVSLRGA